MTNRNEIDHAELLTATPARTFEQMAAQDAYWHQLAFRAGWLLGGHAGRFEFAAKKAQAWRMIRELDRSLSMCLDAVALLEAVEHFDAVVESGTRGEMEFAA